jgi:hypothetical protein
MGVSPAAVAFVNETFAFNNALGFRNARVDEVITVIACGSRIGLTRLQRDPHGGFRCLTLFYRLIP